MLTRWPGALDRSLASFLLSFRLSFFHSCISAPLCANAQLVVLKEFVTNSWEKKKNGAEFLTFFCYLPSFLPSCLPSFLPSFLPSLTLLPSPFPSHPGIGLHVNMEGGGHLDARWCRRVGSSLAKCISRESRGYLGTSVVAWNDQNFLSVSPLWNARTMAWVVLCKL